MVGIRAIVGVCGVLAAGAALATEPMQAPDMPLCGCGLVHGEELVDPTGSAPFDPAPERFLARPRGDGIQRSAMAMTGPCTEDGSQLDILIMYTPEFAAGAGSMTAVQVYADDAIAELNLSLFNSGIPTTANLVGLVQTVDSESGTIFTNLSNLRTPGSGRYDEVHALRDALKADIVSLFAENASGACGIANIGVQAHQTPRPDYAFNVCNRSCLGTSLFTFSHEVGHNLGLLHDVAADPCLLSGAEPQAHGYVDPAETYQTIMSTGSAAPRLQRFSDPNASEAGIPLGEAGVADSVSALLNSVVTASRFRDRDQDGNGLCDLDEIAMDPSLDCDGNATLDQFDIDFNRNGVPDACDIAMGTSPDTDLDGVPDEAEFARMYVDDDAAPGGDGSSWANALDDLRLAFAVARASGDVDELWIAQGVYTPSEFPGIAFEPVGGLSVYGGFEGSEQTLEDRLPPQIYQTILSGDLAGDDAGGFDNREDNSATVVAMFEETEPIVLDGLTVSGGASLNGFRCFDPGSGFDDGGGVFVLFAEAHIRNCLIRDNCGSNAGGALLANYEPWTLADTDFVNNRSIGEQASAGAGEFWSNAGETRLVERCRFLGNRSESSVAAVRARNGTFVFDNCEFAGNLSQRYGPSALTIQQTEGSVISNCTFTRNRCESDHTAGTVVLRLLDFETSPPCEISNSLLWFNDGKSGTVTNYRTGEYSELGTMSPSVVTFSNTTVMGWSGRFGGSNNDGTDPFFRNSFGGDGIRGTLDDDNALNPSSPAIDSGDNALVTGEFDIRGDRRIQGGTVDRGAYELFVFCVADRTTTGATLFGQPGFGDPDGVVDTDDLGYYLGFWIAGNRSVTDFTTTGATLPGQTGYGVPDGVVDTDDLGYFLSAWLEGCP